MLRRMFCRRFSAAARPSIQTAEIHSKLAFFFQNLFDIVHRVMIIKTQTSFQSFFRRRIKLIKNLDQGISNQYGSSWYVLITFGPRILCFVCTSIAPFRQLRRHFGHQTLALLPHTSHFFHRRFVQKQKLV